MATSNRERVGTMFELLAPALDDFIAKAQSPRSFPTGSRGRRSWR